MKPKISIVVPIYNMEAYLARCLDSLISQTFEDIEIVAVNDGSTDASASILERYASEDSRIVAIHKSNGGVSSARNEGIRSASGVYIGFVDPDDWVDKAMYETLYHTSVKEDADIAMCTYTREFGTHASEKRFPFPSELVYRGDEVRTVMQRRLVGPVGEELSNPEYLDAWGTVWSKLYRTALIKDNGLQFVDLNEIGSNEDSLFNIHAFGHAGSFVFLNKPLYHYWRANTVSITSSYNPGLESKFEKLYVRIESYLVENRLPETYHLALNNRICMNVLGLGLNIICNPSSSMLSKIHAISRLIAGRRIARSFERFDIRNCTAVWKLFFLSVKLRFSPGIYFMLQAINRIRYRKTRSVRFGTRTNIAGRHRNEQGRLGNDDHELLSANGSDQHPI